MASDERESMRETPSLTREWLEEARVRALSDIMGERDYLRREVDRLRAELAAAREREAAALPIVRAVADGIPAIREVATAIFQAHDADDTIIKVRPERAGWTISRMRLLLASTDKQARALLAQADAGAADSGGKE